MLEEAELKPKRRTKNDYINNQRFFDEIVKYREVYLEAINNNIEPPRITNYIGEAILDICTRLTFHHRFYGYTRQWKDEMTSDATIACLAAVKNFNPERSQNPFAYFTQVAWNAFFGRLNVERAEEYVKHKNLEYMSHQSLDEFVVGSMLELESHNYIIENFEESIKKDKNNE